MCDNPNCEWRIRYFKVIKNRPSIKLLQGELARKNRKILELRKELEEWRRKARH